jgi:hypothetical protein
MTFYEVSTHFGTIGSTFQAFYGSFRYLFSSRQLLAQTEGRMTHFVTLTVPSLRTEQSLRHITTWVGLRARRVQILFFRENVRFGRFSWAIAHGYRHPVFGTRANCLKTSRLSQNTCRWHFMRFWLIFGHRAHVPGLLRAISLPFLTDNYLLKQKPEWHISSL